MIEAYRISKEPNPAKAFSGQGAKDWGGRWNSKGVAVVYTAAHRSLSILEVLVHVKGGAGAGTAPIGAPFHVYAVSFDAALLEELPVSSLPAGWNSEPPASASQSLGDAWVLAARRPVLAVPSVIVPEERNYLLNPNHPHFPEIKIGPPVACSVDPRLL
ncbi:MAG: RES family NAD+ phosphorylase [Acidobacteriaceae bacterium]